MNKKTRLELTWIGKEERPRLEPRILVEDVSLSYHAKMRHSDADVFDNFLIQGDNLLALEALRSGFSERIQCIYADPPFNTGQAFEQYDDGIEHSLWLSLLRDRIVLFHALLRGDGLLWLHLDDVEVHRARLILDEIFGAKNFVGNVIWEKSDSPRMDALFFSVRHDHILVYAKNIEQAKFKRLAQEEGAAAHYNKVADDGRQYYLKPLRAMGGQGETREARPNLYFAMRAPDGSEVYPKRQDGSDGAWRWSKNKIEADADRIEWVSGRNGWVPYYRIYAEPSATRPPETIWPHQEVGSNRTSKAEAKACVPDQPPFATPKPERLMERILNISTDPGDIVLDSFAGSGTTGAVAHKLNRRWIMVELGDHAVTHVAPRLRKVIDGSDPGGISSMVEWKGGGGFRFFRLAPSLLKKDRFGNWVISDHYNAPMLAEALCKHLGFTYAPSQDPAEYWRHGHSTETDFIYVTTQSLTYDALKKLSEEVGPKRTLLVCCKAFNAEEDSFSNLTVNKIPHSILAKCEWAHDDYSLRIANLPKAAVLEEAAEAAIEIKDAETKKPETALPLFDNMGGN
ncbi:site-specific DNA-methyltransferase [Rhizobium phaseoli]|uniref:site-specific DNA-methyltransferase n=1 Tax=Rhizobium phaseoli TaxID=396 RepID=UPI000D67D9B5|nr:site-specific DNA-methyltransferase [Rhizobium phaseoli]PWI52072.1 site-specific DNA-methyltransferase [Rhizobium phaseoli]